MPMISTAKEPAEGSQGQPREERLGRLLHLAQRSAARVLRAELEPFGLTPVQFALLSELYRCDGLSLNAVADRLRADPPTICGVVDCLVSAGYVERRPDPADRRRLRLFTTPRAREIEADLVAADARRVQAVTRLLEPEEHELLVGLLRRVIASVERESKNGSC